MREPPKLKRPISPLTIVKFVAGAAFLGWLLYPRGEAISDITENSVSAYRYMMNADSIMRRIDTDRVGLTDIINNSSPESRLVSYQIEDNWLLTRKPRADLVASPQRSMYCRISTQPVETIVFGQDNLPIVQPLRDLSTEDGLTLIEESIDYALSQTLRTRSAQIDVGVPKDISVGGDGEIWFVRTRAIYRAEELFEYSYHRVQHSPEGVLHHYCISPFFDRTEQLVSVLSSIETIE